jgi:hypothetical protein
MAQQTAISSVRPLTLILVIALCSGLMLVHLRFILSNCLLNWMGANGLQNRLGRISGLQAVSSFPRIALILLHFPNLGDFDHSW